MRYMKSLVLKSNIVLRFYFCSGNTSDYDSIVLGWCKQAERGPAEQTPTMKVEKGNFLFHSEGNKVRRAPRGCAGQLGSKTLSLSVWLHLSTEIGFGHP